MVTPTHRQAYPLIRLRVQWFGLVLVTGIFLLIGFELLQADWQSDYAWRWLLLAGGLSLYVFGLLWRSLNSNYRSGDRQLWPSLGAGNVLTVSRGILLAALAGFLFAPRPAGWLVWMPAGLYLLVGLTDYLDGYMARKRNEVTQLGEILDLNLDGLGVLVACGIAYQYGQVPFWYLLVGTARYLYLLITRWWIARGRQVFPLPPSPHRRALAGVQMVFLGVMLLPLFTPPATYLAATLLMLPFLVGFWRDGWITIRGTDPLAWLGGLSARMSLGRWLPLAMRLVTVLLMALWLARSSIGQAPLSSGVRLGPLDLMAGLMAGLIAVGLAGRLAAMLVLILIGVYQIYSELSLLQYAILVSASGVFFVGTGPFSWWKPEDWLVYTRAGAP